MSRPHLVPYVNHADVDVVLERIPAELRTRLRAVFLSNDSRAVRRLGWVWRGRREITLCSILPPRVSLRRYMYGRCRAAEFGAPDRGQWPPWAVRRFILYDTLLHELGHLQLINASPDARHGDFARETLANDFANEWRGRLYSEHFAHPDPVHNAPSEDEVATLAMWNELDKAQRRRLTTLVLRAPHVDEVATYWSRDATEQQARFLHRVICLPRPAPLSSATLSIGAHA
jgi:hypothetical protein